MTYTLILFFSLTVSNPGMIVVKHIDSQEKCVNLAKAFSELLQSDVQFKCDKEVTI